MTASVITDDADRRQTAATEEATPASLRVVDAVAAATDADPLHMEPLYEVVDPDALDQLVDAVDEGHVAFEYAGHEVEVRANGAVLVDGVEAEVA